MTIDNIRAALIAAPSQLRARLDEFMRAPTDRNSCFLYGYIAASEEAGVLNASAGSQLRELIESTHLAAAVRHLLKEIDQ